MIKVFNKQSRYVRISGKVVPPFKSVEFEARNQQIRILERNGIISVREILNEQESKNPVQVEQQNQEQQTIIITEENTNENVEKPEKVETVSTEEIQTIEPIIEVEKEEKPKKKRTTITKKTNKTKTTKSKKGGTK